MRFTNFGGYGPFSAPEVPIDDQLLAGGSLSGKVFYVNANAGGTDDRDSPWPEVDGKVCFSTLQAAIDATVANRGDTILIKRGSETVTSTVNFNKQGIRVITQRWGMSPAFRGEFTALLADSTFTNGPVATITAGCYIEGLGFASRDTGATFYSGAACLIGGSNDATPYGVHMKHCRFPKWNLSNRTGLAIEGSSDCLIEECYFEGVGADFENGIYVQGATANLEIRNCRFRDCDIAIRHGTFAGGGPHCIYTGNIVCGADSIFGAGFTNTATGIVCGNWFNTDQGAATFGATAANIETAGIQLAGNFYGTEETGAT